MVINYVRGVGLFGMEPPKYCQRNTKNGSYNTTKGLAKKFQNQRQWRGAGKFPISKKNAPISLYFMNIR